MGCWVVDLTTNLATKQDLQKKTKLIRDAKKKTCNMTFNKF
jgi:hypothetical protein